MCPGSGLVQSSWGLLEEEVWKIKPSAQAWSQIFAKLWLNKQRKANKLTFSDTKGGQKFPTKGRHKCLGELKYDPPYLFPPPFSNFWIRHWPSSLPTLD